MTDPTCNIFQRLNAVQQEVTYVQKHKPAGMRYPVVSHDVVTAKCRPALVKHGILYLLQDLTVTQNGNRTEARFHVRFQNIDNEDDFIMVPTVGYGLDDQDKGPGKAISYGVKIALLKTLGLESGEGEDPDFDQETTHVPEKTEAVRKAESAITASPDLFNLDEVVKQIKIARDAKDIDKSEYTSLLRLCEQKADSFQTA